MDPLEERMVALLEEVAAMREETAAMIKETEEVLYDREEEAAMQAECVDILTARGTGRLRIWCKQLYLRLRRMLGG